LLFSKAGPECSRVGRDRRRLRSHSEYAASSTHSRVGCKVKDRKAAYRKKVKEFFGLSDREHLLGFIYLGYPDVKPQKGFRTSFQEKKQWLEYRINKNSIGSFE
jgi:hypothetical protein